MSTFEAQDDTVVCIVCYSMKRRVQISLIGLKALTFASNLTVTNNSQCPAGAEPCCSRATISPSPYVGEDVLESRIIDQIRARSETLQAGLASVTDSHYMLECLPVSGPQIGASYHFIPGGHLNVSNHVFIAQLDQMVADTFAPKIRTKVEAMKSISSACLGIGYCNMLVFVDLLDNSEAVLNKPDLSPIFAYVVIKRIDELTTNFLNSIRNVQYRLDEESRSWVILWYLYSSMMRTKLKHLGHCKLFDNSELCRHLKDVFESFRKELRACLAADCQNKANWAAPFEDSQRALSRELRATPFWTLSLKWVAWPQPPLGHVHDVPSEAYLSRDQFGETSSTILPLSGTSNSPYLNSTWNGSIITASPPMVPTCTYDELPMLLNSMNGTADLIFDQNVDMIGNNYANYANSQHLHPSNLQQDYSGGFDTLTWH